MGSLILNNKVVSSFFCLFMVCNIYKLLVVFVYVFYDKLVVGLIFLPLCHSSVALEGKYTSFFRVTSLSERNLRLNGPYFYKRKTIWLSRLTARQ